MVTSEGEDPILVRPAQPEDAEANAALVASVQALHAAALPSVFKPAGPETFPATTVRNLMASPDRLFFVATRGTGVVGHAYAEIQRPPETPFRYAAARLYVHQMAVRDGTRGRGIGTRLLAAVREAARLRGVGVIVLDVWAVNAAAQRFYARAGFRPEREYLALELDAAAPGGSAGAV